MNFVLFKYPHQPDIYFAQSEKLLRLASIDISALQSGFVFRPFHPDKEAYFLPFEKITENPSLNELKTLITTHILPNKNTSTKKEDYINYVKNAIEEIKAQKLKKLVTAKTKHLHFDGNIIDAFLKACEKFPTTFVHLSSTSIFGTWLGASPEILVEIDHHKNLLHTMALAGTKVSDNVNPSDISWSQKEIEEQALVSRYIVNCFKNIRLREFEEEGPKTIKAGNLFHLKTDFFINLNEVDFSNLGTTLLNMLHPTSAVCGMPKQEALSFILQNENADRNLYSGFVGAVNFKSQTTLYVNLRCCSIHEKNEAIAYAGAGITADSIPEKEWEETNAKCLVIESVLS